MPTGEAVIARDGESNTSERAAGPLDAAVSEMLKVLARTVRAHQLYLPNNAMHARALDAAREAIGALWRLTERVELTVTEAQFVHADVAVLDEGARAGESLPWLFYKDGVRSFEIRRGFEDADLIRFLDVVQSVRAQAGSDDDLVTLFWECDFAHFSYEFVEVGNDGHAAPGAEMLRGGTRAGSIPSPDDGERASGGATAATPSPFARITDADGTLYFLEDDEVRYLQDAIRLDFTGDLRPSVVAALLDTFDSEEDPTVREEICGILESFLLVLLSNLQFRTVAYLLRECAASTGRAAALLPSHRQRITDLVERMSDAMVLEQLLDALEDTQLTPPQLDLAALFAQLRSRALPSLVRHLVRSRNVELQALLESAVTTLASSNTAELIQLIDSTDEAIAIEAIRRSGALRTPAAVQQLARVLDSPSVDLRGAAVAALGRIGSAGAMQALERCLEDDDRGIRIAVVLACAERQHRSALPRLERAIRGWLLKDGTGQEKTAFLDTYATLAGDAAIPLLEGILIHRGLLARKEDPGTRASAAMALGKLGSARALDVVRKATADKDVVVRNAAARALRGAE